MGSVPIIKTHTLIRHTYNDPCDHVSGICPSGCQDVPGNVHQTVNLTHVDTKTDRVLPVLQVGRVLTVLQVGP